MPTYDYRCDGCGHRFERFHSISDNSAIRCPVCAGHARRVISAGAGLIFKGSGFYVTDYKNPERKRKSGEDAD